MPLAVTTQIPEELQNRLREEVKHRGQNSREELEGALIQLLNELEQLPFPARVALANYISRQYGQGQQSMKPLPKYATASPDEWARLFDAWADSHDASHPPLPDSAMERDAIYGDD